MMSARFLVVALLCIVITAACASCAYRQYSEKTINVSGYVLDAVSRKPVPDVVVEDSEIQNTSRLPRTDSSGHFVLNLSGSRRRRNRKLAVQTLYYEGNTAMPSNTTQQATILLKRNAYRFKPYGCQIPADSYRILPYADRGVKWFPGFQFAFLIRDSTIHQPRKLQTVTFRLGKEGLPREPFRIRIYRCSGSEQPPGEDLLTENIA